MRSVIVTQNGNYNFFIVSRPKKHCILVDIRMLAHLKASMCIQTGIVVTTKNQKSSLD